MILLVGKGFWEWYTDLTEPVAGKRCILLSNHKHLVSVGSPGGINSKVSTCQCRKRKRCAFHPQVRKWHPTPVFLPEKSHGQGSLAGCSPWDCKELNTRVQTEQLINSNMQNYRISGLEMVLKISNLVSCRQERMFSCVLAFPPLSHLRKAFWAAGSILDLRVKMNYV